MFEKYLEIINKSKDRKEKVKEFLNSIELGDIDFAIEGDELELNCSSGERFVLNLHKEKLQNFVKENRFKVKGIF